MATKKRKNLSEEEEQRETLWACWNHLRVAEDYCKAAERHLWQEVAAGSVAKENAMHKLQGTRTRIAHAIADVGEALFKGEGHEH